MHPMKATTELPAPPADDEASPVKVLLAEDHPAMRALIAARLRLAGYDVVEVGDGAVLWEELHACLKDDDNPREADLIISDVRMPQASGLDVLALIRGAKRALPVILMTAFGDRATHEEAARLGAARVFDKPFDVAELVDEAMRLARPR